MPTKINRAGQQQNYVPAGNGDASGEYGDNATGSNKHFTNFKQPDEDTGVGTQAGQNGQSQQSFQSFSKEHEAEEAKKQEVAKNREAAKNNFTDRLAEKSKTEANINFVSELIDDCNDEGARILADYYGKNTGLTIEFGNAGAGAAGYAQGDFYIVTDHEKGTVRHETGHTFDSFFGKSLPANEKYGEGSSRLVTRFVDENGDSFVDIVHRELGVKPYQVPEGGWWWETKKIGRDKIEEKRAIAQKIKETYEKYADKLLDEITGIPNSYDRFKELDKARDKWISEAVQRVNESELGQKYEQLRKEAQQAADDYVESERAKGNTRWFINPDESPKVRELRAKRDETRSQLYEAENKARDKAYETFEFKDELDKLFKGKVAIRNKLDGIDGIVGDSFDYMKVGSTKYQTRGHGNNYFTNGKRNRTDIFGTEIFANIFDCYTGKDRWKYDCIKEMLPGTAAIFEKIIERYGK